MSADLDFALRLADTADALTMARFRAADLRVETKLDLTPVTDADKAVERALREQIAAERPGESVLGEEEGEDDGGATRWIVDPIDGTRNFSRGIPVWATLIALERGDEVVCGVVSAPALGRRWLAARGEGAWDGDGARLRVSSLGSLRDSSVSCTLADDLAELEPRVWHARGFGDFWQHMLVAEGALEACVDAALAVWDWAELAPIVLEAGGTIGAVRGQIVSTNGLVHDELVAVLS